MKQAIGAAAIFKFWLGLLGYLAGFVYFVETAKVPEHQSWFDKHIAIPGPMIGPNARETIVLDRPKPDQP